MARVVHASDRTLLVTFDDGIGPSAANDVRALYEWLAKDPPEAIVDLHPAYATLLVRFEPLRCDPEALARELDRRVASLSHRSSDPGRLFEIPVRYGGPDGPDLAEVARTTGLPQDEVIAAHAGADYDVRFVGFSPGFPYLAGLPESLRTPRREAPRVQVPAGSVAIAGLQAGIYPIRSPGGWNVIGRTDFILFDPTRTSPAKLAPGDRVRFLVQRPRR